MIDEKTIKAERSAKNAAQKAAREKQEKANASEARKKAGKKDASGGGPKNKQSSAAKTREKLEAEAKQARRAAEKAEAAARAAQAKAAKEIAAVEAKAGKGKAKNKQSVSSSAAKGKDKNANKNAARGPVVPAAGRTGAELFDEAYARVGARVNQLATSVDAAAPGQVVAAADAVGARPATLLGGGVLLFAALALAGGGKGDRTPRRGSETGSSDGADPTPNAEPVKASAKAVKEASAPKASAPEASSTDRLERIREMNRANEAAVAEAEAKLKQAASFAKKAEKEVDAKLKKSAVVAKMDAAAQLRAEQKRKAEEELAAEYQRGPEEGARGDGAPGTDALAWDSREARAMQEQYQRFLKETKSATKGWWGKTKR